jgi:hypothetical protein
MDQKPQEQRDRDTEGKESPDDEPKGPSLFSSLIPPPPTLISETLSRYREKEALEQKEQEPKEQGHEHKEHEHKHHTSEAPPEPRDKQEDPGADSAPLHRVSAQETIQEVTSLNATYFTPLSGGGDHFF